MPKQVCSRSRDEHSIHISSKVLDWWAVECSRPSRSSPPPLAGAWHASARAGGAPVQHACSWLAGPVMPSRLRRLGVVGPGTRWGTGGRRTCQIVAHAKKMSMAGQVTGMAGFSIPEREGGRHLSRLALGSVSLAASHASLSMQPLACATDHQLARNCKTPRTRAASQIWSAARAGRGIAPCSLWVQTGEGRGEDGSSPPPPAHMPNAQPVGIDEVDCKWPPRPRLSVDFNLDFACRKPLQTPLTDHGQIPRA